MAIEFFDGFEAGGTTVQQPEWVTPGVYVTSTTGPRTGAGCFGANGTGSTAIVLPASAKKTVGVAYFILGGYFGNSGLWIAILGDSNVTQHLTLMWDASGHLQLRRGTTAGTVLATSTQLFQSQVWQYIEMQATIDDATGTCIVRVDGIEWINFSGDTRNGGTSTNIDAIRFSSPTSLASQHRIDDLYVTNGTDDTAVTGRPDNGFLGDIAVRGLLPSADGAASAWTPSTGTAHAALVDEPVPANTTDYVSATTNGLQDLWALADVNAIDLQVLAVRPAYYAAKTDAGAASIKPVIRESSGTVTVESTVIPLSTTYNYYYGTMRKTKPGGGAWTPADVNGLQLGVEKA